MTVTNTPPVSGPWVANGLTRQWKFEFKAVEASHLRLVLQSPAGIEMVVTSGFFVPSEDLGQNDGGLLTYPVEPIAAIEAGTIVYVVRSVPLSQPNKIGNQGRFFPQTHEETMDLLAMQNQDTSSRVDRAILAPLGRSPAEVSTELLSAAENAVEAAALVAATLPQIYGAAAAASEDADRAEAASLAALENATQLVIASEAQAKAGAANDRGMSPLRVFQAIDARVPFVTPEAFGAAAAQNPSVDETEILTLAINAAISVGLPLVLRRMYRTSGITLPSTPNGLSLIAGGGSSAKTLRPVDAGFLPMGDQAFLIKFGDKDIAGDFENLLVDGVTFDGEDRVFSQALVVAGRLSQSNWRSPVFRRARGPAVYSNKLEDAIFNNPTFVMLGNSDGRPAIVFGPPSGVSLGSLFGSNVVKFFGGRNEWVSGPFVGVDPAFATTSCAYFIRFYGTKFEVGARTSEGGVIYGDTASAYAGFYFPDGWVGNDTAANKGNSIDVVLDNCDFNIPYNLDCVFHVGNVDGFRITNPTYTLNGSRTLALFKLMNAAGSACSARNFVHEGGSIRNNGGSLWLTAAKVTWLNKSRNPIKFSLPAHDTLLGQVGLMNEDIIGFRSFARYAATQTSAAEGGETILLQSSESEAEAVYALEAASLKVAGGGSILTLAQALTFNNKGSGLQAGLARRRLLLRVRAKKVGVISGSTPTLNPTSTIGGATVSQGGVSVSSDTFAWYSLLIDVAALGDNARVNASNVSPSLYMLLDCFTFDWVDYVERTFQINLPSVASGARVAVTTDQGGAGLTIPGSELGDKVDWWPADQFNGDMRGLIIEPQITSDGNMTIFVQNPTAAAIDLVGYVGWKFRATKKVA